MNISVERQRRLTAAGNAIATAVLVFFLLYHLTSFRFDVLFTDLARWVDFRQWYLFPPLVFENLQYPSVVWNDWTKPFPYLPSALFLFWPLSLFPEPVAFGVWLLVQATAYAAVLWLSIRLAQADRGPTPWLAVLGAVLLCENAISWDLRTHNNNLVYLAIVLSGLWASRPWLAGLFLALSANLKIYSGILLALLAFRREYPRMAWMVAWGIGFGLLLPAIVFGPAGLWKLFWGFVGQAAYLAPTPSENFPPELLRKSVAVLTGFERNSVQAARALLAVQIVWLALLVVYFWIAIRAPLGGSRERLADATVALLAPLPFSPWFAPYHSVVMFPACVLLLTMLADQTAPRRLRFGIATVIAVMAVLAVTLPQWELRAAKHLVLAALVVIALLAFRAAGKEKAPQAAKS